MMKRQPWRWSGKHNLYPIKWNDRITVIWVNLKEGPVEYFKPIEFIIVIAQLMGFSLLLGDLLLDGHPQNY